MVRVGVEKPPGKRNPSKRKKRAGPLPLSKNGKTPGKRPNPNVPRIARWLKIQRLRSLSNGEQITQKRLAELLGWPYQKTVRIETGEIAPRLDDLPILADFFDYPEDKLYLMVYEIPRDMQYFLTCTVEGERVVENIRKIMDKTKNPKRKPDVPDPAEIKRKREVNKRVFDRYRHISQMDAAALEGEIFDRGRDSADDGGDGHGGD